MPRRKKPGGMSIQDCRAYLAEHVGDFYAIALEGRYAFGRMVRRGELACYDLMSPTILDLDAIEKAPILFIVPVMRDCFVSPGWQLLGNRPLAGELLKPVMHFREDPITGFVDIDEEGEFRPYADEDLSKLERVAGWSAWHIESRLRDHFAGRPNQIVDRLKYKPRRAG